jgi:hypothetical protein
MKIFLTILLNLLVMQYLIACTSEPAKEETSSLDNEPGPDAIFQQYITVMEGSTDIRLLEPFISTGHKNKRKTYINIQREKGKTESQIQEKLLRGMYHVYNCIENLEQHSERKFKNGRVSLTYTFDYYCSKEDKDSEFVINEDEMRPSFLEVHFVYQDGWKVENTGSRPR